MNGGDVKAVQGDSGHAQVKMVTDVYSHILDDDRRNNARLFEEAFYSGVGKDPTKQEPEPQPEPEAPKQNRILQGTLYLRLPTEDDKLYPKIKSILNMFPGESGVVLYFADTRQRRGTRCVIMDSMVQELKNVLGEANVVLK